MNDFLDTIQPLRPRLEAVGIPLEGRNFEDVYSDLHQTGRAEVEREVELIVRRYFESLCLPNEPTVYDYLLLSLREKDVIATFNWDPFLIQAVERNAGWSNRLPNLLFLHGNVMAGHCLRHEIPVQAPIHMRCPKCGGPLRQSRLLYPVSQKNYESDPVISASWNELQSDLKESIMVTIFGYGAPKSDTAAVELLRNALGDRPVNQIEIIDIRPEAELRDLWEPFIEAHKYHYKIRHSFHDSWIAKHPRRTGEAFKLQYWDAEFIGSNPIPRSSTFEELWKWFDILLQEEERQSRRRGADS